MDQQSRPADAANRLGVEPVGKLLLGFSVPAITGMLANALYNVVDRAFVGRGVAEEAIAGLSLVQPLMNVAMAFAMLFGVGTANLVSMRLGQQRRDDAEHALNHCFWLLVISGILFSLVGYIFLDPLLIALGGEIGSDRYLYAREFMQVLLFGLPLWQVSFGFNHCTRAQGFPKISMAATLIGVGINCALNPLFIFVFKMGVRGSALATCFAWLVGSLLLVSFSVRGKGTPIRLRPLKLRPNGSMTGQIMSFGSSQFVMQLAMALVVFITNACIIRYGELELDTVYMNGKVLHGGDMALSGMNIGSVIAMLFLMPIFGLNQGGQPVMGYNYGAKKYSRVYSAYKKLVIAATAFSTAGFLAAQLIPGLMCSIFMSGQNEVLMEFSKRALSMNLLIYPVVGFQIISTNLFVVTGRPRTSTLLSLSRQFLLLVPSMLILGHFFGLYGVVAALPVSDALTTVFTLAFMARERRQLKGLIAIEGE